MDPQDSLSDLERKREQLEANVSKLRASLKHWQNWEIEYEGMKEDLLALGRHHSQEDLEQLELDHQTGLIGDSQVNLLNQKERRLLLRNESGKLRNANSVVGLLSRRIEYVQQNLKSITSLLSAAEEKLAANLAVIEPEERNDGGLPLTEIHEELDEEGNVISSSTSRPGENATQAIQSLKKAGVDVPLDRSRRDSTTSLDDENAIDDRSVSSTDTRRSQKRSESDVMSTSDSPDSTSRSNRHRRPKKRKQVSFAEGTKAEHDPSEHPNQLPKEKQVEMLRSACNQFRQQIAKSVAATKIPLPFELGVNMPDYANSEIDCAFQILKLQQNRQAKRLLKACDLDSKGAAALLCRMSSKGDYDLESPNIIQAIADVKDLHLTPSSSRESSPRADRSSPRVRFDLPVQPTQPANQTNSIGGPEDAATMEPAHAAVNDALETVALSKPDPPSEQVKSSGSGNAFEPDNIDLNGSSGDSTVGVPASPVIPADESAEDAELRRQMLKYGMQEVGAVVAEMDMEGDPEEYDDDDAADDADMDLDDADSNDEDEDEHGRTVSQVVSGKYLEEMRELEAALKARMMVNSGPVRTTEDAEDGDDHDSSLSSEAVTKSKKAAARKGVRFAEQLDIQEAPAQPNGSAAVRNGTGHNLTSAPVIERESANTNGSPPAPQAKKPSRFKANRQTMNNPIEHPANGETPHPPKKHSLVSAPVIERPMKENNNNNTMTSPDELEKVFMDQQVRNEYHKLRNRMIAQEGGFLTRDDPADDEEDGDDGTIAVVGPEEEDDVQMPKMSRFRAARLGLR